MYVLISHVNNSRVITDKRARVNFECLNFSNAKTIEPDDAVSGESLFLFLAFFLSNILYNCHVSDHFCFFFFFFRLLILTNTFSSRTHTTHTINHTTHMASGQWTYYIHVKINHIGHIPAFHSPNPASWERSRPIYVRKHRVGHFWWLCTCLLHIVV